MYKIPDKKPNLLIKKKINEKKELPKFNKNSIKNSEVFKQTSIYDYMKVKKSKKKKNNIFEN
jgi:hypothetical protein